MKHIWIYPRSSGFGDNIDANACDGLAPGASDNEIGWQMVPAELAALVKASKSICAQLLLLVASLHGSLSAEKCCLT